MVWQTLELSDAVSGISLGGSRAKDYATRLSDWDLYLNGEPARLMAELPGLVAPLRPLAAFWEPLSEDAGYMMVMDGPVKVDLFPVGGRRSLQPPWAARLYLAARSEASTRLQVNVPELLGRQVLATLRQHQLVNHG